MRISDWSSDVCSSDLGQTVELGGYAFRFEGVEETRGPNYISDLGHVQLLRDGKPLAPLHPEKRAYASGGQVMTEAGIHSGLFGDVYVDLGEPLGAVDVPNRDEGAWALRMPIKHFAPLHGLVAALMPRGLLCTPPDKT